MGSTIGHGNEFDAGGEGERVITDGWFSFSQRDGRLAILSMEKSSLGKEEGIGGIMLKLVRFKIKCLRKTQQWYLVDRWADRPGSHNKKNLGWELYWSPRAARTEYHRVGGWNYYKILFSPSSTGWHSRSRCWKGWLLVSLLFLGYRQPCFSLGPHAAFICAHALLVSLSLIGTPILLN